MGTKKLWNMEHLPLRTILRPNRIREGSQPEHATRGHLHAIQHREHVQANRNAKDIRGRKRRT